MYRSGDWEKERYIYELLKQTQVFKLWKKAQFDCQTGKCAWCGKPMQYRWAETDHIQPLYYGGTSVSSNMVLCHHNCNKSKSTKRNYTRPDWIKTNSYDTRVDGKYHALLAEKIGHHDIGQERESIINPITKPRSAPNSSKKTISFSEAFGVACLTIFILIVIWVFTKTNNATPNSGTSSVSEMAQPASISQSDQDPDAKVKGYAESILASYTNYYNNYVSKSRVLYSLPTDAYKCHSVGDGCVLSLYAQASLPDGYTYSVNSLDNGKTLNQPGIIPHASMTNIALYKRARCAEDGTVIGGTDDQDAASVVQLSDGAYYCVQN